MNLLVPAALAFSIIIPIILLLYFMRPRRQERVIGSTLLWQQTLQDLQASRPWQRLRITPLLLLQLLAAIFIVLILARPAIFLRSPISGDTIIILQASASMQATDVAPNRFEAAKSQISDLIDGLGPNDHLSLISMARTPQVLITASQDKGQLTAALDRAKVTNQDAGDTGALQWGSLPATTRFLHAQLIAQDAMTVDDEAWAIAGGSIQGRVLLVTTGNSFLQAALELLPSIDLYKTTPTKYAVNVGNFDLTVFD